MTPTQITLSLQDIESWLQTEISPQAEIIDQDSLALFHTFRQLGDRNLLALRIPLEEGGQGWEETPNSQFQVLLASYSGALAFLSTQHQSATRMIAACENPALKQDLLPSLIAGKIGCGVGFSHLRRLGAPMMKATQVDEGYELSGLVPWVTGYECFTGFICGATLPDGKVLMGWVPLSSQAGIEILHPQPLAAMEATQTVAVKLRQYRIPMDQVVAIHPKNWIQAKDRVNSLHHGFYALGAARGALRLMHQPHWQKDDIFRKAIATFRNRYEVLEKRMFELQPLRHQFPDECLQTKALVNQLASQLAQAAVSLVGGSANDLTHPAQRIYREVLAFTVFGQTQASKKAMLSALSASVSSPVENHPFPVQDAGV